MFNTIGEAAGEIWRLLESEGSLSTSAIQNKTKLPQATVLMGIGWLARENKLEFTQTKRGMQLKSKQ